MEEAEEDMRIGYETMKKKELKLLKLKRNRDDVVNPTIKKTDAVLFTPRQVMASLNTRTCTLNVETLKLRQFIRVKQSNTQRASIRK